MNRLRAILVDDERLAIKQMRKLLDEQAARHDVEWRWVKGHSGVPGNERVDQLANAAIDAMLR